MCDGDGDSLGGCDGRIRSISASNPPGLVIVRTTTKEAKETEIVKMGAYDLACCVAMVVGRQLEWISSRDVLFNIPHNETFAM